MTKHTTPQPSETDLETYGTQLLELDGWRSLKTDPVSRKEWGKGFGELGMADRLYIRYRPELSEGVMVDFKTLATATTHVLWIEWKRLKGKAKPHQLAWIAAERKRGALVWLAGTDFPATPEGFFAHYQNSGLMRKRIS